MTKTANLACSGNTEKKPPGDGHPSGAYFVLTWKYLLSWLSLVYARFFFLSSFVCMLSVASVRLCKAFFICWCLIRGAGGKSPRIGGKAISGHFIFICSLKWPRQVLFFCFCRCSFI